MLRLLIRRWARTGDEVLFHLYVGDKRVGTGSIRSRDWAAIASGKFTLSVEREVGADK